MVKQAVLLFEEYAEQGKKFGDYLNLPTLNVKTHLFPDNELLITLPEPLAPHLIVFLSLDNPNQKLVKLLLSCKTARQRGVNRITLIAPYMCYMRQDTVNHPGEVISQQVIGSFLADLFDDVITVDSHLHRINKLSQAIPIKNAINLLATDGMVEFIKTVKQHHIVFGPDEESEQWVKEIAAQTDMHYAVAKKIRKGDKDVEITLPQQNFNSKNIIIVDDMASTGKTIALATTLLKQAGANEINVLVTHPLFFNEAKELLYKSGINNIYSTNSISDDTNVIDLSPSLAKAFNEIP